MSKIFSVMTYNVHSSIGLDRKISPQRIAEVIAQYNPDVVALQELDSGLVRTEMIDQAHFIAKRLDMEYHFHSSFQVEEGEYGNAVLSRYPMRLVRAGALPTHPVNGKLERRGAVWVEVEVAGQKIQVIATHFGLNRRERICQADMLSGPEWLGHPDCSAPAVLCGDFNSFPGSPVYRRFTKLLRDSQRILKGRRPLCTWPVMFPLVRIDHLFITPDLLVREVEVPRNPLTTVASDHLPLIVTLELSTPHVQVETL